MDPIPLTAITTHHDDDPEAEPVLLETEGDEIVLTLTLSDERIQINRNELRAALDQAA